MAEKKEKRYVSDNAQLMAEWNWEKNNELGLFPDALMCGSGKKVWWKCVKGHEWEATIYRRNRGRGCPYCSSNKVLQGYNDLRTLNPMLAKEWNYEKNGNLKPEHFMPNSGKKVWWKCSQGHEWQAIIESRNTGSGCPYCAGKKVLKGYNDLQTINPALAKEWNYEKNNDLTPADVTSNSEKKVWWKCSQGHKWQAIVGNRNKGQGCPYCAGKKVIKGENDLQSVNPTLAKEWNYERNNGLTPADVTPNSNKKVWWECSEGHEWQAFICHRNKGAGCPYCSNKKVLPGYNDLATTNPELALEWHPNRNEALSPTMVASGSHRKVWWKCSKGHEWQASIDNRNRGNKCPVCHRERKQNARNND